MVGSIIKTQLSAVLYEWVTAAEGVPKNCRQFWERTAADRTLPEKRKIK